MTSKRQKCLGGDWWIFKAFVHVSTAFSHCPRKDIEEKFYEPRVSCEKLLTLVESLNDDILKEITPK